MTHSATVNHGGGLRKERERVYANPCYWSQAGFSAFAGARPVRIEVTSPDETAPLVLPGIKGQPAPRGYAAIDALAALADSGSLLISIVHRGSSGPIRTVVDLGKFPAGPKADLYLLSADVPWAANTLRSPEAVKPRRVDRRHPRRQVAAGAEALYLVPGASSQSGAITPAFASAEAITVFTQIGIGP